MKPVFPTEALENENEKLMQMILDHDGDEIDIDDFIDKNASPEFKKFMSEEAERKRKMRQEGIMV